MRRWIGWLILLGLGCRGPLPAEEAVPGEWAGPRPAPKASVELFVLRDLPVIGTPWSQVVEGGAWTGTTLPTMAFLIKHPRATLLIDAGYGSRHAEVRSWLASTVIRVSDRPPYRLIKDQFADTGIRPAEVTHLLLTHLHADHVGGAVDFPRATILTSQRTAAELPEAPLPRLLKDSLLPRLQPVDLEEAPPYATFAHGRDLFGDGTVVLVSTPGHGAGHTSVFVHLASGRSFFLTGDVAWVRENIVRPVRKGWPMRVIVESPENDASLARVHALHRLAPDVTLVPGHDPDSDRTLRVPPESYR